MAQYSFFVQGRVSFDGGIVRSWAGISIVVHTDLHIIRNGALTGQRYRDEIFRPTVGPYAAEIGDVFLLMDDNCRPHSDHLVDDFHLEVGIMRMDWPACSPDMNPIEHVWDILVRRVSARLRPPLTLQALERALLEVWD